MKHLNQQPSPERATETPQLEIRSWWRWKTLPAKPARAPITSYNQVQGPDKVLDLDLGHPANETLIQFDKTLEQGI